MHLLAFAESSIQLFPDGTIFVHIAILLVMIWILNRTLYRPINRIMEAREKSKGGRSSEAETIIAGAEEKESLYNKELLAARSKGYEAIEKEQKKAAADREAKLAEAKAETAAAFDAEKAELEKRTLEARAEIGAEAEKLADRIAAGILK
ncbi:MAG: ATP synthase F0 subunit B [Pyrinomonadaceae bacterium]